MSGGEPKTASAFALALEGILKGGIPTKVGPFSLVTNPHLHPGEAYMVNTEMLASLQLGHGIDPSDIVKIIGLDLSPHGDCTAIAEVEVGTLSDKLYDQQWVAKRLEQVGCKLLQLEVDNVIMQDAIDVLVRAGMPQGGERVMVHKFDRSKLVDMSAADRFEFVAMTFQRELELCVSAVPDVGAFHHRSPNLEKLCAGLSKARVHDEEDWIALNNSMSLASAAIFQPKVPQGTGYNWVDRLSYRGLRAEFRYVEIWTNVPLVQIRATMDIKKMHGLHMVTKHMVIDFEHPGPLDEFMPIAVYLLNEQATDIIRSHTGF